MGEGDDNVPLLQTKNKIKTLIPLVSSIFCMITQVFHIISSKSKTIPNILIFITIIIQGGIIFLVVTYAASIKKTNFAFIQYGIVLSSLLNLLIAGMIVGVNLTYFPLVACILLPVSGAVIATCVLLWKFLPPRFLERIKQKYEDLFRSNEDLYGEAITDKERESIAKIHVGILQFIIPILTMEAVYVSDYISASALFQKVNCFVGLILLLAMLADHLFNGIKANFLLSATALTVGGAAVLENMCLIGYVLFIEKKWVFIILSLIIMALEIFLIHNHVFVKEPQQETNEEV